MRLRLLSPADAPRMIACASWLNNANMSSTRYSTGGHRGSSNASRKLSVKDFDVRASKREARLMLKKAQIRLLDHFLSGRYGYRRQSEQTTKSERYSAKQD
jgi:hypothetical protein